MMKQWEYMIFDSDDVEGEGLWHGKTRKDAESLLNAFGAKGWEVINMNWEPWSGTMKFKGIAKRERV